MYWHFITIAEVAWVGFLTVWLVLERRSPTATLAWIFGLALLPGVGLPVYLFLGPRRFQRKRIRRAYARTAVAAWTGGRGWRGLNLPLLEDPRHRRIAEVARRAGEAPVTPTKSLEIFSDGDQCFEALLAAVEAAEHHVHLEYYIFTPDRLGTRLCDALRGKALEGVEVRLLLDGFGSKRMKHRRRRPLVEAGGEVRFFNSMRFARFKPDLANFRTHRKIVVVDGQTAFTGGMNIADEHSPSLTGDRAWRDCHLRLEGAAAIPLQLIFLEDWHYAAGTAPEGDAYLPRPALPQDGPPVQIVASGPDSEQFAIQRVLFAAIGQARESILATTPYFVPDDAILGALTGAALRGVDVQLLVPRKSDSFVVGAASKSYYTDLLSTGVRVFEYQPAMIHAKTMVIDDDVSIVGTANLDNRSFRLNFEVVAVIFEKDHARTLTEEFARDLTRSKEVSVRQDADLPIRRRLGEGVARLFSPIL